MSALTMVGICTYDHVVQRWLRTLRVHFDRPCRLNLVNSPKDLESFLVRRFNCDVLDVQVKPDCRASDVYSLVRRSRQRFNQANS